MATAKVSTDVLHDRRARLLDDIGPKSVAVLRAQPDMNRIRMLMRFNPEHIADAFKLIDVAPPERRFLAVEIAQKFYLWGVCIFGCASSPLVWGRLAALLMRLTQGLFDGMEARFNMYVDDILLQVAGTEEERREATVVAGGEAAVGAQEDMLDGLLDEL